MGDYISYSNYFANNVSYKNLYNFEGNQFEYLYEVIQVIAKYTVNEYCCLPACVPAAAWTYTD